MLPLVCGEDSNVLGDLGLRKCPRCEEEHPFHALVSYSYYYIFYIICFITRRHYYGVCEGCGEIAYEIDKNVGQALFPKDGIPFIRKWGWLFGLAFSFILIASKDIEGMISHNKTGKYFAMPQVGDVYFVDDVSFTSLLDLEETNNDGYGYSYLRLTQVGDGFFSFTFGAYAYASLHDAEKDFSGGENPYYLDDSVIVLFPHTVQALYDQKIILRIKRPLFPYEPKPEDPDPTKPAPD